MRALAYDWFNAFTLFYCKETATAGTPNELFPPVWPFFPILNKVHYTTWHDCTENDWRNTTTKAFARKDTMWRMKKTKDLRTILPLSFSIFEQSTFCNPAYLHTDDLRVMDTSLHTVLMMWLFALTFKECSVTSPAIVCLFYLSTENIPQS